MDIDKDFWLTHQGGVRRPDAEIVLNATQNAIDTLGTAVMRHESAAPERYPECGPHSRFWVPA